GPRLRTNGPARDPHPADIVRGYLGASTVRLLSFAGAEAWGGVLEAETDKDGQEGDGGPIVLAGARVSVADATKAAEVGAAAIVKARVATLENHALGEIQDWRNLDEDIVTQVRGLLTTAGEVPLNTTPRIYAAHVVAAGVMAALAGGANTAALFDRMRTIPDPMHHHNPPWGP